MATDSLYEPALPAGRTGAAFLGSVSPAMRALEAVVENVAASEAPILILGESGVGKSCLARQIHAMSGRREYRLTEFVCLHAANDAFATHNGSGDVTADLPPTGTVLLVEISDLPSPLQSRALHYFFGSASETSPRPRLIASSTRNLEQEARSGRFREDLYYLISGVCLRVPPLRHRREDILPLADHFLEHYSQVFSRPKRALSARLQRYFVEYGWPGNVRELENTLKMLVAVGDEQVAMRVLRSSGSEVRLRSGDAEVPSLKQAARAASRQAERELILKVLSRTRWNRKRAAEELQISYKALLYKLKQIGLDDESLGSEEMFA